MKLINAGFGRTGTTSLKAALERLGFGPVFHSTDLIVNSGQLDIWERALQGETIDWRAFFEPYEVADWPVGLVYRDVIRAHPEAKVMVSVRDPEGWVESITSQFQQIRSLKLPVPRLKRMKRILETYAVNGLFEGRMDDRAFMAEFFERHTEAVKAFVGSDNLLVYSVKEGWDPLCTFLGVEAPEEPFPRLNERGGFREMATRLFGGAAGRSA